MVDLLHRSLAESSLASDSELTLSASSSTSAQVDPAMLGQIVLRWREPLQAEDPAPKECGTNCLMAMQRLVKRIAQLRSTEDGSTTATPEALLVHVAQEAQDVWVHSTQPEKSSPSEAAKVELPGIGTKTTWCLRALAPQLLWEIARSTHEAVRLIEGVTAQVNLDGKTWQSGILRLVVALELKTTSAYRFDLVTFQSTASGLPECQIQIQDSLLGQQPVTATSLLQQMTTQMIATAPALSQFFKGFAADWLVPGQVWQAGVVGLNLGFEFISVTNAQNSAHQPDADQSDTDQTNRTLINDCSQPLIKFTQPVWLEQHITQTVEHQLTQVLRQIAPVQQDLPPAEALVAIVQQGCAAIDGLQCSLALASRTFAQQILPLEDLALRVLWGINRTAYEVMQLTSGLRVNLLQSQQGWSTGTLRFVLYLTVRTPEQDQQFDLARRSSGMGFLPLDETAIVQTCENRWCADPILLSQLEAILWQHLNQGVPEISLLQSGSEVTVIVDDDQELGVIQLQTGFEFIPDLK